MESRETTLPLQKKSDVLKLKVNVKWQAMWLDIMQGCRGTAPHTHSRPWYCTEGSSKLYIVPPSK
jgi:hypothetical protein